MNIQEILCGAPSWIRQTFSLRHHSKHGKQAREACKAWISSLRAARRGKI